MSTHWLVKSSVYCMFIKRNEAGMVNSEFKSIKLFLAKYGVNVELGLSNSGRRYHV